jgi:hypothetical protein
MTSAGPSYRASRSSSTLKFGRPASSCRRTTASVCRSAAAIMNSTVRRSMFRERRIPCAGSARSCTRIRKTVHGTSLPERTRCTSRPIGSPTCYCRSSPRAECTFRQSARLRGLSGAARENPFSDCLRADERFTVGRPLPWQMLDQKPLSVGIMLISARIGDEDRDRVAAGQGAPLDVRQLIRDISIANPLWGAPRIHGELLKLGIDIEQTTVAKDMARSRKPSSQGWKTFLRNHVDVSRRWACSWSHGIIFRQVRRSSSH